MVGTHNTEPYASLQRVTSHKREAKDQDARGSLFVQGRLRGLEAYQDLLTVAALKAVTGQQQLGRVGEDALWVLVGVALQGVLQEGAERHGDCRGDGRSPAPTPPAGAEWQSFHEQLCHRKVLACALNICVVIDEEKK